MWHECSGFPLSKGGANKKAFSKSVVLSFIDLIRRLCLHTKKQKHNLPVYMQNIHESNTTHVCFVDLRADVVA